MIKVNVFFGAKSISYETMIAPMVGDNFCKIPEFSEGSEHFIVTDRLPSRDHPNLITLIVKPK